MNAQIKNIGIFIILNLTFALNGCGQSAQKKDTLGFAKKLQHATIKGNFSSQTLITFDSLKINTFLLDFPKLKKYESDIWDFYRKRNFTYAWFEDGQLIEQAGNLTNRILSLENDGVFKKLFYAHMLDSLVYGSDFDAKSTHLNINLELMLTGEYFVFSGLVWEGMSPFVRKSNDWFLPRKQVNYTQYLDSLLQSPAQYMMVNEPVNRQYELLKSYLRKYRILEQQDDWNLINSNAKKIIKQDSAVVISQLKKRLHQLEDYQGNLLDTLFDNELTVALNRFQQRHGLAPVGKINRETIVALNVPLKNRIKQILVNMERSRWLPVSSQGDHLAVNIPEFKLHVYHDQNLLWSCNAVVGQTMHATTLFYGEINQIVFSPYWNVPESIVRKEILPGIRKNSNYLASHQMESIGSRNGLPIIRQKPGSTNSLGLVKFLFPNSYSIYLHDTPSKSLFKESTRAFSHGCIRIAEPAKLASFLLKDDPKWNEKSIELAMNKGSEKFVTLSNKVPVFITYFTAFVDRSNKLNFRKDIYQLDEKLAKMIISGDGVY